MLHIVYWIVLFLQTIYDFVIYHLLARSMPVLQELSQVLVIILLSEITVISTTCIRKVNVRSDSLVDYLNNVLQRLSGFTDTLASGQEKYILILKIKLKILFCGRLSSLIRKLFSFLLNYIFSRVTFNKKILLYIIINEII